MDSTIEHLSDASFADAVSEGITVIDFWAAWCGPCRAMAPQFERAAQLRPQYRFAKVDVDAEPEVASRYAIRSIPTLMVLRDGTRRRTSGPDPGRTAGRGARPDRRRQNRDAWGEGDGVMNSTRQWPLERVVFALAGTVTLLSAGLAAVVSPWFLLLTAFVGINQWLYVVVGACPASVVLRRACGLRSPIYENGRSSRVDPKVVGI